MLINSPEEQLLQGKIVIDIYMGLYLFQSTFPSPCFCETMENLPSPHLKVKGWRSGEVPTHFETIER